MHGNINCNFSSSTHPFIHKQKNQILSFFVNTFFWLIRSNSLFVCLFVCSFKCNGGNWNLILLNCYMIRFIKKKLSIIYIFFLSQLLSFCFTTNEYSYLSLQLPTKCSRIFNTILFLLAKFFCIYLRSFCWSVSRTIIVKKCYKWSCRPCYCMFKWYAVHDK